MKEFSMKHLWLAFFLVVFSSSTALAWTMTISMGSGRYECRQLGSDLECRVNGAVVGWVKQRGGETVYTDNRNTQLGSAFRLGNGWQFKGPRGTVLGTAQAEGSDRMVYKDGSGRVIGYAKREGSRTAYTNAGNTDIGRADTNSMPLRPLPLEAWLKKK